jgi:hypothetical protein
MDNDDSNDDTHHMGVAMGEHVMRVYPMTMMVTHTTRCSSSVLCNIPDIKSMQNRNKILEMAE